MLACEKGQYSKAVEALSSAGVAPFNEDTVNTLRAKHPESPLPIKHPVNPLMAITVKESMVRHVVHSFPKDTGCGRSGLRISHIRGMIATKIPDFLKDLAALFTIMINGRAPVELAPYLSSAPLVPLLKKDGKIRPIAIGEILRRICSKMAVRS
jgi:hypothetical protein